MKDFFRHNGILILIAAILLALVTAVVSMLFGGVADPLSNLVGILTTPVRNGITAVTNWAEEKYNDAFELEQMKEELAGLKQRNAELEAQAREAEAALQENERLRNLLELQPKEWSCDKAAAMVTARSTSNWGVHPHHWQGQRRGDCRRRLRGGRVLEPGGRGGRGGGELGHRAYPR